jgi:3-oxoadipate enol-lactonase
MIYKGKYGDVYYELIGPKEAPVIVFIHGVGMDHKTFDEQLPVLKDQYCVLLWDLPGHGQSTLKDYHIRYSSLAAICLVGLLKELGIKKAILVGQSLGSLVSQRCLLLNPKVVVATIHVGGIQMKSHFPSWIKLFLPLFMTMYRLIPAKTFYILFGRHRAETKKVQEYLIGVIEKTGKELVLKITKDMVYDMIEGIPATEKHPLLITYGNKDLAFIRNKSLKWHKETPGSQLQEIKHANHIANQDNPEAFNNVLIAFLKENQM